MLALLSPAQFLFLKLYIRFRQVQYSNIRLFKKKQYDTSSPRVNAIDFNCVNNIASKLRKCFPELRLRTHTIIEKNIGDLTR